MVLPAVMYPFINFQRVCYHKFSHSSFSAVGASKFVYVDSVFAIKFVGMTIVTDESNSPFS